jgi:uncharacterized membrane protein
LTFVSTKSRYIRTRVNLPFRGLGELGCDPAERMVEHRRPMEPDPDNTGGGKEVSKREVKTGIYGTRFVAFAAIFSALLAILSAIKVPMPPPLWSISLYSLGIFIVGILFGPKMGFIAGGIGGAVAEVYNDLGTIGGSQTAIYVASAFIAKGAAGLVIGYGREIARALGQTKIKVFPGTLAFIEALAMVSGRTVELTIFFLIDTVLYGMAAASVDYLGMLTLITIPIALTVNEGVRRAYDRRYFDV